MLQLSWLHGRLPRFGTLLLLTSVAPALLFGCSGPGAQVSRCQKEKEELLSAIRSERDKSRDLAERSAALESRLDQSEKQVAMLTSGGNTRWAQGQPAGTSAASELATRNSTKGSAEVPGRLAASGSSLVTDGELKWRSGKGVAGGASTGKKEQLVLSGPRNSGNVVSEPTSGQLEQMARRDRRLKYDPHSGLAKFQTNVAFEGSQAALTDDSRSRLDELTRFLKTDDKNNLRILVVGKPAGGTATDRAGGRANPRDVGLARAQAVADYLDRHGIAADRLAVTGIGKAGVGRSAAADAPGTDSPVEIYLVESGTNIAGWEDISRQKR